MFKNFNKGQTVYCEIDSNCYWLCGLFWYDNRFLFFWIKLFPPIEYRWYVFIILYDLVWWSNFDTTHTLFPHRIIRIALNCGIFDGFNGSKIWRPIRKFNFRTLVGGLSCTLELSFPMTFFFKDKLYTHVPVHTYFVVVCQAVFA